MPKQIFFDGLNLGVKRGTGTATYTRVLANLTRDMGHRTGILYSRKASLPRMALDREVAFFDNGVGFKVPRSLQALSTLSGHISAIAGVRPKKVATTGAVITEPLLPSYVPCDELYAAPNVFERAQVLFAYSRKRLRITLPAGVDLFHWTYPLPMTSNARANIYTVHDLIPLRLPYTTLDWKRHYLKSMRAMLAKADHIVTVSENSKRDIIAYFGVEERRITNTYQAVHIPQQYLARPEDSIASELEGAFGLGMRNYMLFFGSLEPKKNVGRIVQAYLAANIQMPLVIVSAQSWLADDEARLLEQIFDEEKLEMKPKEQRRIRRYDYMPFRVLMTLIQGARAVLFPSLYEGFGLPILEAMTLGTPVVTSNTSSIPEVAGDAAIMVNPYDVEALRKAIVALANDEDLCSNLRTRGLRQAGEFSLDKYRERMSALYTAFT